MFTTAKARLMAGASVLAIGVLALGMSLAQAQDEMPRTLAVEKIKVGTYEAPRAFENYHKYQEFIAYVEGLQQQAMAAEQAGDMQRLMELDFQARTRHQELVQTFESTIERIMPDIARERNLQLIALEIVYAQEGIEPVDVTDEVIRELNAGAEVETDETDDDQE